MEEGREEKREREEKTREEKTREDKSRDGKGCSKVRTSSQLRLKSPTATFAMKSEVRISSPSRGNSSSYPPSSPSTCGGEQGQVVQREKVRQGKIVR